MSSLETGIGRERVRSTPRAGPPVRVPPSTETGPVVDAGEPHPRRRLVFAIVSLGLFMAAVDTTIVATALHPIGQSLHSTINWTAWTVTIYQLGQIMAMPLAGKISDQFGRKRVYVLSAVVFTTSSLACGLSTSIYMLVAFRLIQAIGGGAFMPSASGIVADHFGRDRDKALAMFTSIFPIGGIVGPVFGGLIAQDWSWRGIFFVNVPIGTALVILAIKFLPKGIRRPACQPRRQGRRPAGAHHPARHAGHHHPGDRGREAVGPPLRAAVCGLVRVGRRLPAPFTAEPGAVYPRAAALGRKELPGDEHRECRVSAPPRSASAALVPLYAQNRYHLPIASAGTLLTARALGTVCLAGLAAMMLRRTGCRLPMVVGFSAIALSLVMLAIESPAGVPPYLWLAGWSLLTGLGMGVSTPATNNATLQLAPDQVAQIAGLRGMFRQSGGILSVSITTALLARSSNPGITQAYMFLVEAAVSLLMVGLVFLVPDHKGRW